MCGLGVTRFVLIVKVLWIPEAKRRARGSVFLRFGDGCLADLEHFDLANFGLAHFDLANFGLAHFDLAKFSFMRGFPLNEGLHACEIALFPSKMTAVRHYITNC